MSFEEQFPSIVDLSNPCIKCGSIQCSFCSDDIQEFCLDKVKVKEVILSNFHDGFVDKVNIKIILKELGLEK